MTYKGIEPIVEKVTEIYRNGVSLTKKAMKPVEARLERKEGLEWWFITIHPRIISQDGLG
ncbi:MAG: hypothetical protein HQL74_12680 [Magnetococcales bacterium]|nr:hypothetical protein [Magnetococcales bacterium]